jgi:hypothetical protein
MDSKWISSSAAINRGCRVQCEKRSASLRISMSHVLINCDHVVSWFKHEDPRFKRLYERMQNDFANQDFGYRVCLHEATHAVLMEIDGLKNVRFSGPEIYYDFGTDAFVAAGARVTCDDQPDAIVNDEYKFMMTRHMVAGGVALRKFKGLKEEETGSRGDFADFLRLYKKNPPSSGEAADALWKRAEAAVDAMLEDAKLKEKILARADEYCRVLYQST